MISRSALQRRRFGLIRVQRRRLLPPLHSPAGGHPRRKFLRKAEIEIGCRFLPRYMQISRSEEVDVVCVGDVVGFLRRKIDGVLRDRPKDSASENCLHRRLADVPVPRPQQPHRSVHRIHRPSTRFKQQRLKQSCTQITKSNYQNLNNTYT